MSKWVSRPLGELATITSGGTPSTDIAAYWGGEIPWVTPTDITACRTNFLSETKNSITKKGLLSCSAKLLPAGTILFTSRATVGVSRIAGIPVSTNQGFKSLTAAKDIDGTFLFYQIQRMRGAFERYAAGSTFPEINKGDTARVAIPHPVDSRVQQKIATILSTIDTAIEQTEALIEKYQHIKAGLMHDLFTRGVLPTGQLRPPREQAPELYQETAMGWIPREWQSVRLFDVANLIVGFAFKSEWFVAEGINLLRGENVGYGVPGWLDRQCLAVDQRDSFTEYELSPGDVVIGMDRTFTKSGVKITQLAAVDCPALLVQRVGKFVATNCDADYLRWLIVSSGYLRSLFNQQKGMDIPHLSKSEILEPLVPMPNNYEQRAIALAIQKIANLIKATDTSRQKLQTQKLGLMQDLLTGKVSVQQ